MYLTGRDEESWVEMDNEECSLGILGGNFIIPQRAISYWYLSAQIWELLICFLT